MSRRYRPKKIENSGEILDISMEWNPDDQFEVEKILDEDYVDDQRYYLIKWKGFNDAMNTWEAEKSISHLENLIKEYAITRKGRNNRKQLRETTAIGTLINPYAATEIHGHFLYGDRPKSVANTFLKYHGKTKKIYLEVEWEDRQTEQGFQSLENSIIDTDTIFEHAAEFLLGFYSQSLKLGSTQR